MSTLYKKSIEVLENGQQPEGSFLACPNFDIYRYAWLRDGSFCAYALDLCAQPERTASFHNWVFRLLARYRSKIEDCIEQVHHGTLPPANDCLHSRFQADGSEVPGNWGHHQLDGLGTWLWAYGQYAKKNEVMVSPEQADLLRFAQRYLLAMWPHPCSDCWEENEDKISTHSLSAVYAGLKAAGELLRDAKSLQCAEEVQSYLLDKMVFAEGFRKNDRDQAVDASLLFLAVPYQVVSVNDHRFRATVKRIERELTGPGGGVRRFAADTYYGGGEWILLAASLGWVACEAGNLDLAQRQLAWVEAQATSQMEFPEQVSQNLNNPNYLAYWEKRWGPVATPLLWSHAQYLILHHALARAKEKNLRD